jgi:hypothetical protein
MYLRNDEGFLEHPKTLALCRIVQNPEGAVFIQRVWVWAVRSSPDGNLTGLEPADIEDIAKWRGTSGALYAALVGVGFIDELEGGARRVLHDWHDWTGADVRELEAEARRKRVDRRHRAGKCGGAAGDEPCPICVRGGTASGGPSADSRRMSTVDQTRPVQTRPDPEKKKTGRSEDTSSSGTAASPPVPASPTLLVFPTVRGKKSGATEWHYTEAVEAELREYFPGTDIRSAVREALGWVKAKQANKKTANGMLAFVQGWLRRARARGEHKLPSGSPSESRRAAEAGLGLYCDWHKQPLNEGRPSQRPKESCPSCKHLTARERVRPSSGPATIGALADEMPGWGK